MFVCALFQGHISLDSLPRRGYHIPAKGTVQVVIDFVLSMSLLCHSRVYFRGFYKTLLNHKVHVSLDIAHAW